VNQGHERRVLANVEGTHPFGCVELVAGNGEKIYAEIVDPRRDLSDGLGRIGVKENALLAAHSRDSERG
jgi:hypothetical protein